MNIAQRIEELTKITAAARAAKRFDSAYFNAIEELETLKRASKPVAPSNEFKGSYADACAFFGGAVRKARGGLLQGSASVWVKR